MREGERIQVKTQYLEGMATILYIAPGEFYPVQVELDGGDEDGHKIHRITWQEIVTEPAKKEPGIVFSGPKDQTRYIGEVVRENGAYGFKKGDRYLLGVVAYPGVFVAGSPAKSFYLFDPGTLRFRGCMPASAFSIIGPYKEGQVIEKRQERQPEPEKVARIEVSEQLSLF